jgi:phosphohistidine phosphatase SixA/8-oxo-dGTP pyrophosphatase MutT (NUDIX family)
VSSRFRPKPLAAGGVVWRRDSGRLEVALVHRPRYDDWTLPKGKLEPGERALTAAVREVGEELGAAVEVGRRLVSTEYQVGSVLKPVGYWSMRYLGGEHTPSNEVDAVRWLSLSDAAALLSYPGDLAVLEDFAETAVASSTLLLIRHAKAGKRSDYRGEDRFRPLDKIGRRQARDSVGYLSAFGPSRVVSADRVRCVQTVAPLAEQLGVPVSERGEFSDEAYLDDPEQARKALLSLLEPNTVTALCSQGGAIPGLLEDLGVPESELRARKGSLWVLSFDEATLLGADYYPRPQL